MTLTRGLYCRGRKSFSTKIRLVSFAQSDLAKSESFFDDHFMRGV